MINRLITFSVRNKFLVFAVVAAACIWGTWSMLHLPLDAMPDLSETQVIIFSRWDRSPDIIEDQVTYPIVTAMTGRAARSKQFAAFPISATPTSTWCSKKAPTSIGRARGPWNILSAVHSRLAAGREDRNRSRCHWPGMGLSIRAGRINSGKHSLAELRSYQDWYLKYYLKAVPGVAEVASRRRLHASNTRSTSIPTACGPTEFRFRDVADAVRSGNSETGARLLEFGGAEYMIRGRGYVKSPQDLEDIVLWPTRAELRSALRMSATWCWAQTFGGARPTWTERGEAVSGIVIMREGSNALDVIDRVKKRLKEIEPGMPAGVRVVPIYDRSELIRPRHFKREIDAH